jgi:hypothetical protein
MILLHLSVLPFDSLNWSFCLYGLVDAFLHVIHAQRTWLLAIALIQNHISRVDLRFDEPLTFRLRFLQYSHAEPTSFLTLAGCHLATVGEGPAAEESVG